MANKTIIKVEPNKQEVFIEREFDSPVEFLFKAHVEPKLVAQWMGTNVIKLENKKHGSYHYETTDPHGNKHGFHGTFHEILPNKRIIRTFKMENTSFPTQLEFFEFEKRGKTKSKLTMQLLYKSVADRDNMLKLPFEFGLNMAHNKLQEVLNHLK
ncbi:SRPBCC domain-containing protein [Mariniflexile litorale]|uniref:SRPBCC domain-containing protein n=1 Tax=Mariniflexile litorale TaxID=3045158 RepID=A0AAU7EG01_9FLAO|nr:SRPBCC domain-containing protein [Mariniflexile sp. KMM 9835]MDQ8212034.1 SRPBCC domain-containing protein [Mariniflexile sp. KMM 9835]